MFDGDSAGRRAVLASREAVREAGLGCRVANLPDGTDPDEFVRRAGAEALTNWTYKLGEGLLEYLIDTSLDSGFP